MASLEADFDGFERKVILIIFVLLDFLIGGKELGLEKNP